MAYPGFWSFLFSLVDCKNISRFRYVLALSVRNTQFITQHDPFATTVSPVITNVSQKSSNKYEILLSSDCVAIRSIINITVEDKDNNTSSTIYLNKTLQNKIIVNSTCEQKRQDLSVSWSPNVNLSNWKLIFVFGEDSERYDLERIGVTYTTIKGNEIDANTDRGLFTIPVGGYYECASRLHRELFVEDNDNIMINIYFLNSSMEAFRLENRREFMGHAIDCPLSILWLKKVPTIVCSTLILIGVAIVLIYLCSRLSKRSTYETIR
ncbi:hypothetical protein Smp_075280.1 [Schistosoma mansoni]|uniref:hypothetical protein n=1 Tax=Schistosoma mansoni TaxID=6183 RepID=UPI0001A62AA9|nr:hypothetical protein Smp_075280.1 [Schistosoma mansoni]|eukprot:XP_018655418.1 hypothetical protein Smp_075280.1 [Schistosoma mansoni]